MHLYAKMMLSIYNIVHVRLLTFANCASQSTTEAKGDFTDLQLCSHKIWMMILNGKSSKELNADKRKRV